MPVGPTSALFVNVRAVTSLGAVGGHRCRPGTLNLFWAPGPLETLRKPMDPFSQSYVFKCTN